MAMHETQRVAEQNPERMTLGVNVDSQPEQRLGAFEILVREQGPRHPFPQVGALWARYRRSPNVATAVRRSRNASARNSCTQVSTSCRADGEYVGDPVGGITGMGDSS